MIEKWKDIFSGSAPQRLDLAAVEVFPNLSRKKIKLIIDSGGAYVNKRRITMANHLVAPGASIELLEGSMSTELSKLSEEIVHFQNNEFLVINKPAGVPSQATLTDNKNHVIALLESRLGYQNLHLVHRLDKDTSGIMIVAKTKQVQAFFEDLFQKKLIQKQYLALCFGKPTLLSGRIDYPIAKVPGPHNRYSAVTGKQKNSHAKSAVTDYQVLEYDSKADVCLVLCKPQTGRTHQIRVHLAALGHPILGDKTYSLNIMGHQSLRLAHRQQLHAYKIEFTDSRGTNHNFAIPPPHDFKTLQEQLLRNKPTRD